MPSTSSPHQDARILEGGASLDEAAAVMILLHGRGASAQGMLALSDELDVPEIAYLAPQATGRSWYPASFMAPIDENEPELSSALDVVGRLVGRAKDADFTTEQTVLLGFSQGACLATEYAARTPTRYGGVVGLSGGLIGPENASFEYEGNLDGTPVFLGCSDQDPYIPLERVEETATVLRQLGAQVTKRIYEGMGHTTNDDEMAHVRTLLREYVDVAPKDDDTEPPTDEEN